MMHAELIIFKVTCPELYNILFLFVAYDHLMGHDSTMGMDGPKGTFISIRHVIKR